MSRVKAAGVRGSREIVVSSEIARGRDSWGEGSRQGVVVMRLFGAVVRVMA